MSRPGLAVGHEVAGPPPQLWRSSSGWAAPAAGDIYSRPEENRALSRGELRLVPVDNET